MTANSVARRFRLPSAPTLLARPGPGSPVTISRLTCHEVEHGPLRAIASEDAFAVHVTLKNVDVDFRLGGRNVANEGNGPGLYLLDLDATTMVNFRSTFDIVRFHITRQTLDELTREAGSIPAGGLMRPALGTHDPVLDFLARALLPALERPEEANELFVDHVIRAFHAHVTRMYAAPREPARLRQALTSWQARAATELIAARLDGKVTVRELADACNLSVSHFSRAFVQTYGMPPHRWLIARRIDLAKDLIVAGNLPLPEIASACGFATQSHFTRVFTNVVGTPPSRWGREASPAGTLSRPRQRQGSH